MDIPTRSLNVMAVVTAGERAAGAIVAVTKASFDGKAVQTCTVAITGVDCRTFVKSFFAWTDAEKIAENGTVRRYPASATG